MLPSPTRRAVIDIGHKCNIKCLHCYYWHEENQDFKSVDTLKKEITAAKARGNHYIDFTGGEPTLHPEMPALVNFVRSEGLQCCIITNGLAGKEVTKKLIDAGVDDWLVSTHGTEKIHDTVVQVSGARKKQERFLKQITDAKGTYRFNCCILSYTQSDLSDFATWALSFKPRIVNLINFNPHHSWGNDTEGTKKQIADLSIVEPQLNTAVALFQQNDIGVNVRYYPMCKISETFRSTICNDMHVLFDPYEWDYDITPKTMQRYTEAAINLSNQNEWKAQPCLSCDLKYMCGGLNSNFHRASGMKSIKAINGLDIPKNDFYYYRRLNETCLTDRIATRAPLAISTIVDDNYKWYIPLFLHCARKNYPDADIKVFARFTDHAAVKEFTNRYVGFGVYDHCVISVVEELTEYADTSDVTKATRFVEFEKYLIDYQYVLFTDIDIFFTQDGDLVAAHLKQLQHDSTQCYENWLTIHNGASRLSGVHFITHAWWCITRMAREYAAKALKQRKTVSWDYDETVLYTIVQESHLPIPPQQKRLWRLHGVHVGDWIYHIENNSYNELCNDQVQLLFTDEVFMNMAGAIKAIPKFNRVVTVWQGLSKNKVSHDNPVVPKPISLPKKKKFEEIHYDGSLCIYTVVDGNYAWYVPLFLKSLSIALPDIDVRVVVRGELDSELQKFVSSKVVKLADDPFPQGGWTTAAMRYVTGETVLSNYDYVLYTDIDMLMYGETKSIIDQHMMHLTHDNTKMYENWITEYRDNYPRMPGVHFVTREWFYKTEKARDKYRDILIKNGASEYCTDELMIGRIVVESGLNLPPDHGAKLWRHHGVHLGDWRLNIERKIAIFPDVWQLMHIDLLRKNEEFMELAKICGTHIPLINQVVKLWPGFFR